MVKDLLEQIFAILCQNGICLYDCVFIRFIDAQFNSLTREDILGTLFRANQTKKNGLGGLFLI